MELIDNVHNLTTNKEVLADIAAFVNKKSSRRLLNFTEDWRVKGDGFHEG